MRGWVNVFEEPRMQEENNLIQNDVNAASKKTRRRDLSFRLICNGDDALPEVFRARVFIDGRAGRPPVMRKTALGEQVGAMNSIYSPVRTI